MKTIDKLLKKLGACEDAIKWAKGKSWEEIYKTCPRGDWLLWLFKKTNPDNLRELTLAKGHCANTVRHLMKDKRSRDAVDTAIKFGEGKISKNKLYAVAAAAAAAAADADAADAVSAAADAAAAYAADADADATDAAKVENQQKTADICRRYLPIEIWNI